ncbi:MAG TPA: carbohydrate kinase family protein [Mycobacteriales bacterium]|nr:carbohydrate kinase family protein [Mycobacteriales bacterium]
MRILLAGSVATDEFMTFSGRFAEQILPDQLSRISLSFLTDELVQRRGGTGANIAFGLGSLGVTGELVAAVGPDFDAGYRQWLEDHNVNTKAVRVSETRHSARFVATIDRDMCQIGSFYAGAMLEARDIDMGALLPGADLLVVSPDDEEAMIRNTALAREAGVPFVADTSFQLAHLQDADRVRSLVDGATWLMLNDYEKTLLEQKSGWSDAEVLDHVGTRITTLGPDGVIAERKGEEPVRVAALPERVKADPTGAGDAFRGGFLAALSWGLGLERCLQLGATLGTLALEVLGPQEWSVEGLAQRFGDAYGADALAEIVPHLPAAAR